MSEPLSDSSREVTRAQRNPPPSARLPRAPGLEDYRLLRVLGRGGMGAVFEVLNTRTQRRLALKTVSERGSDRAALERARQRFQREAELSARLNHPGILKVLSAGFSDPPYLLVDLLPGGSLAERIEREGRLPVAEALEIALRLTQALRYAHSQGVVHRDLKPENVLFDAGAQPVLVDFGVAVSLNPDTLRVTRPGELIGTPAFMSPEQATGEGSDAPATDAYALGGLLYAMLLGRPPLDLDQCGSLAEALARITAQRPRPLRPQRREIPRELDALTQELLNKEPQERPDLAQVEQTLADLLEPLGEPRASLAPLLAALGVSALAGGLGALWGAREPGVASTPPPALTPSARPSLAPAPPSAAAIAAARRLRGQLAPYDEVRERLRGEDPHLVRERMELAVARAQWSDALSLTRAHDQHPRFGRELRLLRAWALVADQLAPQALDELTKLSARADDRWGLLARSLLPAPPPGLAERLRAFPDCPWSLARRYVLNQARPAQLAEVVGEIRRLLEAGAKDVVGLYACLTAEATAQERDSEVRALLAQIERLSAGNPPISALSMERKLELRAGNAGLAFELLERIARRRPGEANVPLAVGYELRRDLAGARKAASEGLRLAREAFLTRLLQIPEPRAQRVLRYAGATTMSTRPLSRQAEAELDRRVAWVPAEQRAEVRALLEQTMKGLPWHVLDAAVSRSRARLGGDRRWLELEFALQASRQRAEQAADLARRLRADAPPSEQAEWRLLSTYVRFGLQGPSVLPRFADLVEQFPGTGAATLARCVLRVEAEPAEVLELLRQVEAAQSAPRCGQVVAGARFIAAKAEGLLTVEQVARYARPHFERVGFLNPQMAKFTILPLAAVRLHDPSAGHLEIEQSLRHLELLGAALPSASGFAHAARLALRLPAGSPWHESVPPWLWFAELQLKRAPASLRRGEAAQLALARGVVALAAGEPRERVLELWRGAPLEALAPWERQLFETRFGPLPGAGGGR